jgi:uncharacterized protein YecE (DUF72 family)
MTNKQKVKAGRIYAGMGGFTYAPWRGVFYPKGLAQSRELAYAASHVTSIEINGTFDRTQSRKTYESWAQQTPDEFKFALKGPRYAVNRRELRTAGDSIKRFYGSGVLALGDKLGPVLWQFAPTKKFDSADFGGFLELLPRAADGWPLRHVVEVRHDSFRAPDFIALARSFAVPIVFAEHETYPAIADLTGDFVYLRLQKGQDAAKTGYPPKVLDAWAERVKTFARGGVEKDLPVVDARHKVKAEPRDVFVYFIHEGKIRAPAAAMALIERVA